MCRPCGYSRCSKGCQSSIANVATPSTAISAGHAAAPAGDLGAVSVAALGAHRTAAPASSAAPAPTRAAVHHNAHTDEPAAARGAVTDGTPVVDPAPDPTATTAAALGCGTAHGAATIISSCTADPVCSGTDLPGMRPIFFSLASIYSIVLDRRVVMSRNLKVFSCIFL